MRAALPALAVVTGVHLASQLTAPGGLVADLTQVLLMPLVAAVLVAGTGRPRDSLVTAVLVALGFSWLGDTLPRFLTGDAAFLVMVGCFLVAQVVYARAFWPFRERSVLARPALVTPYLVALGVLVALCARDAGALLPAVVVYGVAIVAMAVLATGLGRLAGLGGAVFMLSDALIALDAFADVTLPGHPFWVMSTYVAGQLMLALAVVQSRRELADAPPRTPSVPTSATPRR